MQVPAAHQVPAATYAGAEAEEQYSLVQPPAAPSSTAAEGTAADPGDPQVGPNAGVPMVEMHCLDCRLPPALLDLNLAGLLQAPLLGAGVMYTA